MKNTSLGISDLKSPVSRSGKHMKNKPGIEFIKNGIEEALKKINE